MQGILSAHDAEKGVDAGVDGIVVSNHGGRQLDTAPASLDALPAIAAAVGKRVPVLMDGGIRRGTDIIKVRLHNSQPRHVKGSFHGRVQWRQVGVVKKAQTLSEHGSSLARLFLNLLKKSARRLPLFSGLSPPIRREYEARCLEFAPRTHWSSFWTGLHTLCCAGVGVGSRCGAAGQASAVGPGPGRAGRRA